MYSVNNTLLVYVSIRCIIRENMVFFNNNLPYVAIVREQTKTSTKPERRPEFHLVKLICLPYFSMIPF